MMLEFETVFWLRFSLKFEVYPIKGPDDVACNFNEDYSLIDFFTDDAPELTDTQESWTDYYDNLDSADVVEGVTRDPRTRAGRSSDQNQKKWNLRTAPHEDQRNLKNLAPTRTERSADQAVRGSLVRSTKM